jgi:carboxylesterase type B
VKLAKAAKLPSGDDALKALRSAPVEQLLAAFAQVAGPSGIPPDLGVNVDGYVLPRPPAEVFSTGKQIPAGLIVGINAREFMGPPKAAAVKNMIESKYGTLATEALPLYGITTAADGAVTQGPPSPLYGNAGAQWMTDTAFRCPAVVIADWNSRSGHPTYQYQFNRGVPGHPEIGATHASEVPYVFGTLDDQRPVRPNMKTLTRLFPKPSRITGLTSPKPATPTAAGCQLGRSIRQTRESIWSSQTTGRWRLRTYEARSAKSMPRIWRSTWQERWRTELQSRAARLTEK